MGKLPTVTHHGELSIGSKGISCAVLDDGTRLLSNNALYAALDKTPRGLLPVCDTVEGVQKVPSFLAANNLKPFIHGVFRGRSTIKYIGNNGMILTGYDASVLPRICKAILAARRAKVLVDSQQSMAIAAEILLEAFAEIGVVALIDEATGYQHERSDSELHNLFVATVQQQWQLTFPESYYIQLHRIYGIPYVKGKNHPQFMGKFTDKYVYCACLPADIVEELRIKANGDSCRWHQYLTEEIGRHTLLRQVTAVTTLMELSETHRDFPDIFDKRQKTHNHSIV